MLCLDFSGKKEVNLFDAKVTLDFHPALAEIETLASGITERGLVEILRYRFTRISKEEEYEPHIDTALFYAHPKKAIMICARPALNQHKKLFWIQLGFYLEAQNRLDPLEASGLGQRLNGSIVPCQERGVYSFNYKDSNDHIPQTLKLLDYTLRKFEEVLPFLRLNLPFKDLFPAWQYFSGYDTDMATTRLSIPDKEELYLQIIKKLENTVKALQT